MRSSRSAKRHSHASSKIAFCCLIPALALTIIGVMVLFPILAPESAKKLSSIASMYASNDDAAVTAAFEEFMVAYKKEYATKKEREIRKQQFSENYRRIMEHNSQPDKNFELGINQFADYSMDEVKELFLSKSEFVEAANYEQELQIDAKSEELRDIDWVEKGKVSPVKDQGPCGSCWTFSSIAAVESLYAIKKGVSPINFSEQQLVDCCKSIYSDGCNGGERWNAFEYISNAGIALREKYPYLGYDDVCKKDIETVFKISGFYNITPDDNSELAGKLLEAPVSVGVNVVFNFLFYKKGVLDKGCSSDEINHGVVAVGVNLTAPIPYYKIKNSWGPNWGDNGYILIKRSEGKTPGLCAVAHKGCMPLLK